tara:strand:- start:16051 stop:16926 length:876 start_codon:yes stop_codon:yes gene_type:complete
MGGKSRAPQAPPPVDPGQAAGRFLFGDEFAAGRGITDPEFQRRLLEAERTFGPQYVENELAKQQQALFGTEGQEGLLALYEQAAPITERMRADAASRQRAADIADVERYGAQAVEAIRQSDPERARLIEQQQGLTDDLYARAQGVTPQQRRMAEQSARAAYGARGREMDNAGMFAEALGREEYMRQNRAEAMGAGQSLYGMLSHSGADPMQAVLGRPAQAIPYNFQTAQGAMGAARMGTPQTFNPDTGINLALQQRGQQMEYDANVYGARQAARGSALGGFFSGLGSIFGS